MTVVRNFSSSLRTLALLVTALTGLGVLVAAPSAFAVAPSIVSVAPAEVGMGAGQSGHAAETITIAVDNVAVSDTVTVTFPGFTGLSAVVQTPLTTGGGHTVVTAKVSTSSSSVVSSGFNLTLTDTTTSSSDTHAFAIVAAPVLTSASPDHVLVGTTTSVTLTGTGLQNGVAATTPQSGVTFGAVAFASATSGTVSVTVGNNVPGGPLTVTLTNPDGGWSTQSGALNVDTFPVNSISPTSASNATSSTAVQLTVAGQGIPTGSTTLHLTPTFQVAGQDPLVVNPTSVTGTQWQGNANLVGAAPGAYQVQLVNGTQIGTLTTGSFTVTSAGAPTISTVTPSTVGQGADTTLTLTGTNFARGASVTFSKTGFTTTGPVVYTGPTQIAVPVHVASNAATGVANATNVTVTNTGPAPSSGTKTAALQASAGPTITTFSPSALGQGAATTLTINGTGFQSGATVTFGTGITATGGITSTSTTQLKIPVKVASNAPATVDVTVKNTDLGSAKMALPVDMVTLTSAAPRYVSNAFIGNLVLSGAGFRTGATVTFPAGSGVTAQSGKSATMSNSGATLTVPITVTRTTAAAIDVTVTNTSTDFGSVTCTGCLGVAVAPSAPTGASATKSGTGAVVQWNAVTSPSDGGAPITGYTVTVTSPANSGIAPQSLAANVTTATFNNLTAGVEYVFAITATNQAALTSKAASASTSRTSRLTLHAGASRVVTGQSVRLFGQLLNAAGAPIAGVSVVVHRRSDSGGRGTVGDVTTDASGRWSLVTRPRVNQTYSAAFAGDGTNLGTSSAGTRVVAAARVTIHGSTSTARQELTVYGRVVPNKSGETVRLVAFDKAGRLHHLGRAFLNGNSRYKFHMAMPAAGWRLQVRIGATGGNGAGSSSYLVQP